MAAVQLGCDICTYVAEDMWSAVCRQEGPGTSDAERVVAEWVTGSCDPLSPGRTTLLGVFDVRSCDEDGGEDGDELTAEQEARCRAAPAGQGKYLARYPPWSKDEGGPGKAAMKLSLQRDEKAAMALHAEVINKRAADPTRAWQHFVYDAMCQGHGDEPLFDRLKPLLVAAIAAQLENQVDKPQTAAHHQELLGYIEAGKPAVVAAACTDICNSFTVPASDANRDRRKRKSKKKHKNKKKASKAEL